ncbi:MAG TPA: HEPN domain-containing protein [Solirubrobacterales bacterium]|nr:HEPN domain-containing protein [Solirubrobacterales bacterium]
MRFERAVSSPRRESSDLAALYSRKAGNDATAAREFADNAEISDEIIGFHAQQAVEKWLKAVMAKLGLPQQRTHDIDQLGRLLEEQGVELPVPRSRLAELTDFAVPLRYEDLLDAEPLDRRAATALVDEVAGWAADQLG